MSGSTRKLDRDRLSTNKATDRFASVFFNAANKFGVTDYWFEMRVGAILQDGFKTLAALQGLDFSEKLRYQPRIPRDCVAPDRRGVYCF
jgi:hypothetical protein